MIMGRPAPGPLDGLKVIELAHVMAGPTCGRILADLGADVIKLERPGGEDSRRMAPPWVGPDSAAFAMMNRNKRNICLDLKSPQGRNAYKALARNADVIIENFRKGAMARLELDYAALSVDNPGLIYCEISGFGRTGPMADQGGFDLIAQAMSGLMSITGEGPGRAPVKVGAPLTDITAGLLAAIGVLAALDQRRRTGRGQCVETSLLEAGAFHTMWQTAMFLADGREPQPMGSAHPLDAPYQAFEGADGWFVVGAANQSTWEKLVLAIDTPELAADPRFIDNPARMINLAALEAVLTPIFKARTIGDWLAALSEAGVPCAPILSIGAMTRHPQIRARDMIVATTHHSEGRIETIGTPIKFSDSNAGVTRGVPALGADTRAVLVEAGISAAEVDALIASGAAHEA